jgi:hypothetical protein
MKQFPVVLLVLLALTLSAQAQKCELTLQDLKQNPGAPPTEVNPNDGPGTCGFLKFSWKAFLAMNWPAIWNFDRAETAKQTRGLPDQTKLIGQGVPGDPTVWELYQPNWYIFTPNNPPPSGFGGWNQDSVLPSACGQLMNTNAAKLTGAQKASLRMLSSLSKFDGMPGVTQANSSAPLIDQNGFYARYEIRTSFETFNYLVGNQFYLASAQENQTFSLPVQNGDHAGAIFLKAAWKVLSSDEEKSGRFHTARAFLFTPSSHNVKETCVGPVPVGLVGLHIVQKTASFPDWIWATFEQVDNTPADPTNPSNPATQDRWSFFENGSAKSMGAPKCPNSSSPCQDWQPTSSHRNDVTGGPTQAIRFTPIPKSPNQPSLDQINQSAKNVLGQINPSSIWQFYQLVEAQWHPLDTAPGTFFPSSHVANTTMETYTQKASCMACHGGATAADGQTSSDLTFELSLGWRPGVLPASRIKPSNH